MKFTKGPCGDRHHTRTKTERSALYLASLMCPAALKHSSLQPLHFLPEWTLYIIDHTAQPIPEKAVSSIIHLVCLHNTDVTLTNWPEQPLARRCSAYVMVLEVAWAYPGTGRWDHSSTQCFGKTGPRWISRMDRYQGQEMNFFPQDGMCAFSVYKD